MVNNEGVGSGGVHGDSGRGAGDETLDHPKFTLESSEVAQTLDKKISPQLKSKVF